MIVVTGGAGFIGSALIAALNTRNISDILVIDHLGSSDKWKNLARLSFSDYMEKDRFIEAVLADKVPADVEAIFHLGACSSTVQTDASYLVGNNYEYSKILARWAAERSVRFIYASSAATYGDGSAGFSDDHSSLSRLRPLNMYGFSKQLFDLWALRKGLLDKAVGLKYFNVYGPNEYHKAEMRSFVIKAFEQIKESGRVRLFKSHRPKYADGEQLRDFLYVKDAVDATLFFLDKPEVNGVFNIGSGRARSWNDLVKAVFEAMGRPVKVDYVDMPPSIRNQYQYYTQADISKLRRAGYEGNTVELEEGVADYVRNYLVKAGRLGRIEPTGAFKKAVV